MLRIKTAKQHISSAIKFNVTLHGVFRVFVLMNKLISSIEITHVICSTNIHQHARWIQRWRRQAETRSCWHFVNSRESQTSAIREMENSQEHYSSFVSFYGAIYSFSSEWLKLSYLTNKTGSNEFNPQGTANLQSSINAKDSLGTISLSAIYGALVVSCIFLPSLIIRKLTAKWALFFSMMCYAPYIAAQFHPRFYTLIPVREAFLRFLWRTFSDKKLFQFVLMI